MGLYRCDHRRELHRRRLPVYGHPVLESCEEVRHLEKVKLHLVPLHGATKPPDPRPREVPWVPFREVARGARVEHARANEVIVHALPRIPPEAIAGDRVREDADVGPPESRLHATLEPFGGDCYPVDVGECALHHLGILPEVLVRVRVPCGEAVEAAHVEDQVVVVAEYAEAEPAPVALVVHHHCGLPLRCHTEEYHGGGVLEDVLVRDFGA